VLAERLSPEQKQATRGRYKRWRELPPEKRQQLRERWQKLSPEERKELRKRHRARHPKPG
jgi:acyl-CoA reductase-like NAD-dependent aldehyde dehydrogenase